MNSVRFSASIENLTLELLEEIKRVIKKDKTVVLKEESSPNKETIQAITNCTKYDSFDDL